VTNEPSHAASAGLGKVQDLVQLTVAIGPDGLVAWLPVRLAWAHDIAAVDGHAAVNPELRECRLSRGKLEPARRKQLRSVHTVL